jgi:hypothetical protein
MGTLIRQPASATSAVTSNPAERIAVGRIDACRIAVAGCVERLEGGNDPRIKRRDTTWSGIASRSFVDEACLPEAFS